MYPILFNFGTFSIPTYGVFVALAFFSSVSYLSRSLKKSSNVIILQDELNSLVIYMMIFGIVGSRLLFVITNFDEFISTPLNIIKIWQGGLVYYGGFIAVTILLGFYLKHKKKQILKFGDFFSPALALGHAIGRIGCFFSGCCYGKKSSVPWAVTFSDKNCLAVTGVRLHPTQLYEILGNLLLFAILHFYSKKNPKTGTIFAIYLIFYAALRFIIEFFRGDFRGEQYMGLSISQIISVIMFIIGICIYAKKTFMKNLRRKEQTFI